MRLKQIADFLSAQLQGDPNCEITSIGPLDKSEPGQISYLEKAVYRKFLEATKASAVIVRAEDVAHAKCNLIIVADPYVAYAKISALFDDAPKAISGIHPSAVIGEHCEIDATVSIAPHCVIGNKVKIGKNSRIGAGTVIGDEAVIGANTKLYPNVTIYHKVKIGDRTTIHSGAVVGSDGFGNANEKGHWVKIYQLGTVIIGNDVEIGANTSIDRGALENTVIEDDVKLDNQIQIGHNVHIGAHTAIAGYVGIAGSTKIGRHCLIGGGVGITGHIEIADGVIISGKSAVGKSITEPGIYASGVPAMPARKWWRILNRLANLDELAQRVNNLEKKHNETA